MKDIVLDIENGVGLAACRSDGWRKSSLLLAVVVAQLLLGATAVAGQQMAAGAATVRVLPVAHMEVEPVVASAVRLASVSSETSGAFRIQVRANHGWEIRVAAASAPGSAGTLWVRTSDGPGGGEYRRVESGAELAVASGAMGETVIRLDYRWVSAAGVEAPVAPLTYTLVSR